MREEMVSRTVAWTRRWRSRRLWPLPWRCTARERSSFLSVPMRPIVSGLWARAARVDTFVSTCACVQCRALVGNCDHYRGAGQSIRLRNLIGLRLSTLSVVSATTQDKITPETLAPSMHHPLPWVNLPSHKSILHMRNLPAKNGLERVPKTSRELPCAGEFSGDVSCRESVSAQDCGCC